MDYQKEFVKQCAEEIYNISKKATTLSYIIPYDQIESFGPSDKEMQSDICEYIFDDDKISDEIQSIDFDNENQRVVVMWYLPPNKIKTEEVSKMKKYTLDNYEEFVKNALLPPPIEEFEDGTIDEDRWYEEHKIRICGGQYEIELDYNADNTSEIEFALKEMYEVETDLRYATTGNTVGNEYRDATWKDILRLDIMRRVYSGKSMKEAIHFTIRCFDSESYRQCMYEINNQNSYNDEFEVNFFRISSDGMEKLFEGTERRAAIKEMLCKDIQLSEMIDQNGAHDDKTIIMDYSIHPSGYFVGWHYGVDWDMNSVVNQEYINDYIKEMIG